ncbi:hypothetical protein KJ693_07900 [bacterium]|nr:hypothetical protein [bacterium]MBU1615221.1 hypothetical protein [bacterium]
MGSSPPKGISTFILIKSYGNMNDDPCQGKELVIIQGVMKGKGEIGEMERIIKEKE